MTQEQRNKLEQEVNSFALWTKEDKSKFIKGAEYWEQNQWIPVADHRRKRSKKTTFYLCTNGKYVFIAFYTGPHETVVDDPDDDREYDAVEERDGQCYLQAGWYKEVECYGGEYDYVYEKVDVTHFAHLPSLPKTENNG